MTNVTNIALVHRLFEDGFSNNNADILREVLAEDFVQNSVGAMTGDEIAADGACETVIREMRQYHQAFSGWSVTLEHIMAEGDHVAVRWIGKGRHTGSFYGDSPTDNEVLLGGNSLYRIADGKIAQGWVYSNETGFRSTLGLSEGPPAGPGEALVRRFWKEVINGHNPDAADALLSPDYRQHAPGIAQGPEGFKAFFRDLLEGSSGMRADVLAIVDTGAIIVSLTEISFDVPGPGWPRQLRIVDVFRTDGDRLTEHWDTSGT
ncbi:hypothetical protein AUC68_04685 [Methyloceanibacter methanicus]|uniref:SnoaL-like domain-containing protein n=1 Tax=Methyloceanibacter methanicus TaxID=1774968 RepID=A0A1E3W0F0_9HYPH|nr:ester cyclase [Methyloceanibacter methanicus]ODR99295.1 hypothetical protein AUC68_04685 [Methyloceanibacter methanicus]